MKGMIVALLGLLLVPLPPLALAQDRETFLFDYAGLALSASRDFEATVFREGALAFDFSVLAFKDAVYARQAFQDVKVNFLSDYSAFAGFTFFDVTNVRVPQVGTAREGTTSKAILEGVEVTFGYLFVLDGDLVHVWGTIGARDPFVELASIAEAHFADDPATATNATIDLDGNHTDPAILLGTLPTLEQMPPTFIFSDQMVVEPQTQVASMDQFAFERYEIHLAGTARQRLPVA